MPSRRKSMIDAAGARESARRQLQAGPQRCDPQFQTWEDAGLGEPRLVHDADSRPAYWLVPVQRHGRVVGAVRVLPNGQVAASIAYRGGSDLLSLEQSEILKLAAPAIGEKQGERAGKIVLVYDRAPGREAWRVEVLRNAHLVRWVFITPGGIYQRACT